MLANETDPVIWRGPVLGGVIKQFWGETLWQNIDYMFPSNTAEPHTNILAPHSAISAIFEAFTPPST